MGLPSYSRADKKVEIIMGQLDTLRSIESRHGFRQQLETDIAIQNPEQIEGLHKNVRDSFVKAYESNGVSYTEAGVNVIAKMDLVRTGMYPGAFWRTTRDIFVELVNAFSELDPVTEWRHYERGDDYYLGNGLTGYYQSLVIQKKISLDLLQIDDTLDILWSQKSGENLIFCSPKDFIIIGGKKRELTVGVYAAPFFDPDFPTWLLFDGEIIPDESRVIKEDTLIKARMAVASYSGPTTSGSIDHPSLRLLCESLGFQIKKIEGMDAIVLPRELKGQKLKPKKGFG